MNNKSKASHAILYVSLLAFMGFVLYILHINQEVLYTAHDRSEFLAGTPYFDRLMSKPFGLMQYVGAWLTQLFYHPALGAGVLAAIWVLIYFVGTKAFRLQGNASSLMLLPVACLLASVVDLGYWIYIFTIRGYWFSHSVAYLIMLLLLWAARSTPRKWHLAWYVVGACTYPVLGWYALLFILCLVLCDKMTWREGVGFTLMLFTAVFWRALLYSNIKPSDVTMAGLPHFVTPSDSSEHLSFPFYALGIVTVLIPLCHRFLAKRYVPVLCAAIGIIYAWSLMFHDKNYITEMRMVRLAENDNWKEILHIAEEAPKPTTTMVFLKNVALMNEGGQLDRSFKMGNITHPINNPDSIHVTILDIASPLVYYNYGMENEAIRLNYEMAIQSGFCPFYLKTLARCTQATGEEKLKERYLALLHQNLFYGDWQPAPVNAKISELQKAYPDELTGIGNSDLYIVENVSLWYEAESKVASEQALFYSMMRCNASRFWQSLRQYVKMHEGEEFPLHAQEAYILFMDKAPEEKRMMIPVNQDIYERYKRFWETLERLVKPGKTFGDVADEMQEGWGDTYWYYFIFGRQYTQVIKHENNEIPT